MRAKSDSVLRPATSKPNAGGSGGHGDRSRWTPRLLRPFSLCFLFVSALLILPSCAHTKPVHFDHPVVDGKSELLPDADLQIIVRMTRHRLDSLMLFVPIRRVHVTSATEVEVFFRKAGDKGTPFYRFDNIGGEWRITQENYQNSEMPFRQPDRNPRAY